MFFRTMRLSSLLAASFQHMAPKVSSSSGILGKALRDRRCCISKDCSKARTAWTDSIVYLVPVFRRRMVEARPYSTAVWVILALSWSSAQQAAQASGWKRLSFVPEL